VSDVIRLDTFSLWRVLKMHVKVKLSHYRPGQALGVTGG
jgi:hypothetical protein